MPILALAAGLFPFGFVLAVWCVLCLTAFTVCFFLICAGRLRRQIWLAAILAVFLIGLALLLRLRGPIDGLAPPDWD